MKNNLAILLSTYNGSKFLREQLDSIINQNYNSWTLYIRDDGSSDITATIINEYVQKYDNIVYFEDSSNLGSALSFMNLLRLVEADYYMFCDQDDFWFDSKISDSLNKIKSVEVDYDGPALIFADLKVTDEKLRILSDSFWNYNKVLPELIMKEPDFINVFNCAPGCTMIFNSQLRNICNDYDNEIIMHDWYIMIKASLYGKVDYVNAPLMLYRQHFNNVVGADKVTVNKLLQKFIRIKNTVKSQLRTYNFVTRYTKINLLQYYILKIRFNSIRLRFQTQKKVSQ